MQDIPQLYQSPNSSLLFQCMFLEGLNSLKDVTKPLSQNASSLWPPTKEFSLWKGLTFTIYCFILSGHPQDLQSKQCPKLKHWRWVAVATIEDPSDPPCGIVSISYSLIHKALDLPSVLTSSIPLYSSHSSFVSLAIPLSPGVVSEQKMKNTRRNPSLAGFMVEQAVGRNCLMPLYFRFGLVGGLSPPNPRARIGHYEVWS